MTRILLSLPDPLLNDINSYCKTFHYNRSEFMRHAARLLIEKPANGTISSLVSWSKEGQIFYDMYENNNWDIYSVKPDGADETKLTNTPYNENLPSVSPTENRIAYVSDKLPTVLDYLVLAGNMEKISSGYVLKP